MRAKMFEARWTSVGLDALHRERFTDSPDESTSGVLQRKLMDLPRGRIVALLGPRGTGKTQAAQNAVGVTLNSRPIFDSRLFRETPRYTSAAKIFRAIRDAQKRGRDDDGLNEAQTISSFVNPPILVVDEAHERGETDFENRTLNEIIDDRYAARRTTILISNLSRAEFAKSIGPSIVSRIHECGETIECNWPSFREKATRDVT